MEVGELVGEIRAHEMSILGMSEEPTLGPKSSCHTCERPKACLGS